MKKRLPSPTKPAFLLFSLILAFAVSKAQIVTTAISPTTYCAGAMVNVPYTTTPNANSGNVFTAQLSDASGSFASPVNIGTRTATTSGTISATIPVSTGNGNAYRIRVVGSNPAATGSDNGTDLTINALPVITGSISGPVDACPLVGLGTIATYSISPVAGAVSYTWTVPVGVTITSGQGTNTLNVTFDNSFALTNSYFRVVANSAAGCASLPASLVVLKNVPAIPTAINGPIAICNYLNQPTNATYSVNPVQYATSYTWTVPNGATIMSGQGTTSVQVKFANPFSSGSIKVTANSNCGARAARSLTLTKFPPRAPTVILGAQTVCQYVGTGTQVNYSIAAVPTASGYVWTVPANVTIMSGQGTTSINVKFNSSTTDSSVIKVHSVSDCGMSVDRTLSVFTKGNSTPGAISGPVNACEYINSAGEAVYTIRRVANANSYIWTVPTGATIVSHPAGNGINDTIIHVTYNNSFVSGGLISVKSVGCLTSSARNLTITGKLPSRPGAISGPVNACEYVPSVTNPSGLPATYTIRKVPNTNSYSWTAPPDASITAHPGGTGENDTIVEVMFNSNYITGSLSVTAVNLCGNSTQSRTLLIRKLLPATPGGITATLVNACPNRIYTYSIAQMPSNATSVQWTVPAAGTITNGQGTTSITVSYPATAVTGSVKAMGVGNCGNSSLRSLTVNLAVCPPERPVFAGKQLFPVTGNNALMSVKLYPNPSVSVATLNVVSNSREKIFVKVFDLQGRVLNSFSVLPDAKITVGDDLQTGTYIIEIIQGEIKRTERFIKQ